MTNDTTSLVLSLQLSPLLSVPEDTNLNMIVQTYIEIYVALEDISIHLTRGCWCSIADINPVKELWNGVK